MAKRGPDGNYLVPKVPLQQYTLLFDPERHLQVMMLEGAIVLPVGTKVELVEPNVEAEVIGLRLRGGSESVPASIILDLRVPEAYWD